MPMIPAPAVPSLFVTWWSNPSVPNPWGVQQGRLTCHGLDFLFLEPVSIGDIELSTRMSVVRNSKAGTDSPFYCMLGYGLNSTGAYVGSACLTHLEVQASAHGKYKLLEAYGAGQVEGSEHSCPILLKGTKDRIIYQYADLE